MHRVCLMTCSLNEQKKKQEVDQITSWFYFAMFDMSTVGADRNNMSDSDTVQ